MFCNSVKAHSVFTCALLSRCIAASSEQGGAVYVHAHMTSECRHTAQPLTTATSMCCIWNMWCWCSIKYSERHGWLWGGMVEHVTSSVLHHLLGKAVFPTGWKCICVVVRVVEFMLIWHLTHGNYLYPFILYVCVHPSSNKSEQFYINLKNMCVGRSEVSAQNLFFPCIDLVNPQMSSPSLMLLPNPTLSTSFCPAHLAECQCPFIFSLNH